MCSMAQGMRFGPPRVPIVIQINSEAFFCGVGVKTLHGLNFVQNECGEVRNEELGHFLRLLRPGRAVKRN